MSGWCSGLHDSPLAYWSRLVSTWFRSPAYGGLDFKPSRHRGLPWRRARASQPACRRRDGRRSAHRRVGVAVPRQRRTRQHRRHDRVPRPRPQRGQRRLDQPPGAHRPRRHQGLPGQRDFDQRRLSGAHVHLGDHAAHPRRADRTRGAHRDVARRRHRAGPLRRRARRDGQRAAAQRDRVASTPTAGRRRDAVSTSSIRHRRSTTPRPGPSVQFARTMRDQLQASGIPPSNYIGQGGL